MEKNADGKLAFTRITLRPKIQFAGEKRPSAEALAALHHSAHEECFIANSLKCAVVIEGG
jgi:organic hydroperoxide reductase OsmC/OhrA